ncbi:SMI1/KNR4 family protein [Paraburkholderia megapolitana]|nr:SMI1/KNR4 family protein [Paraburkholderia megapolitana]
MSLPDAFSRLFVWIEENHLYVDTKNGRIGFLYPEHEIKSGWTKYGRPGGTNIEFAAEGNANLKYWFGHERTEVMERLCVFAKTGAEGSMAAFWLDPNGQQKIVHLGSGSGSTTVCVLALDAVDFLRLLAIGYDEICWGDQFSAPPNAGSEPLFSVAPNEKFQEWLRATFNVTVPSIGLDIVPHPDDMHNASSKDAFNRWVAANVA